MLDLQESAGRQWPLYAKMPFSYDQFDESGVAENAVIMPGKAIVVSAAVIIEEAFDSGDSDAIEVGDPDDADRYGSADAQSLGYTALTPTGHRYEGKQAIQLTWTGAGTPPTAGSGVLLVSYIMQDRATETQPAVLQA